MLILGVTYTLLRQPKYRDSISENGRYALEMLMLDYPSSAGCAGITGQWQALTALYRAGKVRSVAVSNFAAAQLSCLFSAEGEGGAVVPPVANQMRFYVGHTGVDLGLNARHGIVVQAYSPLGNGALICTCCSCCHQAGAFPEPHSLLP